MGRLVQDVREMVSEQFEFRELLYQMVRRDLLIRYKQSIMGFGWAVFMPLVNTIIFSVVFMRVAPIEGLGVAYPLYAFTGLLAWNLTAMACRFSTVSLTSNPNLVTKVYFPREIFPFSAVIVSAADTAVGAILLVALMVYYKVAVTTALLFLPVVLLVHLSFTAGVSLILSMGNLFYRDVKYLFEVVVTAWMFATSVLYPLGGVGGWPGTLLRLNPMTPIIDAYRSVLLYGQMPALQPFLVTAAISFAVLAAGWVAFHRSEFEFAENI
jgi:ABC-type polysaccharide/polyol phosphate export permease